MSHAKNRKAIAFCCNAGYRPYALFAAYQIATLRKDNDFDILICDAQAFDIPPALARLGIASLALTPDADLADLSTDDRRCASAYYRLLLPSRLGGTYDRILYLDADIHIQGGDFSRLMDMDLYGAPIGAVRDNPQWRTPGRIPKDFKALNLPHAPYFNSGVLLIDTAAWKTKAVDDHIAAYAALHGKALKRHDQTLLNAVLRGDWAEMSPVWNWQYSRAARLHESLVGANIIHFIGRNKPWNAVSGALPPRFGQSLSRFLADHLPATLAIPAAGRVDLGSRSTISMLLRHAWNRRKMARYLGRFRDDYTALTAVTHPKTAQTGLFAGSLLFLRQRFAGAPVFASRAVAAQQPPVGK